MDIIVKIHKSEFGFDISCPTLKGCHSQGDTEEEAIENIKIAIKEYLDVLKEINQGETLKHIEVAV